jgi:hypothetical protein
LRVQVGGMVRALREAIDGARLNSANEWVNTIPAANF